MNDTTVASRPDSEALFATSSEQAGYFTAAQARAAGYSWNWSQALRTCSKKLARSEQVAHLADDWFVRHLAPSFPEPPAPTLRKST